MVSFSWFLLCWAKRNVSPILALSCQINQMSDKQLTKQLFYPPPPFPPPPPKKISLSFYLTTVRSNYKQVHHARLKKSGFNSQTFPWCFIDSELVPYIKNYTVCPKKILHLTSNRTKAFSMISEMFFLLDKGDANLDFDILFFHLDENCPEL